MAQMLYSIPEVQSIRVQDMTDTFMLVFYLPIQNKSDREPVCLNLAQNVDYGSSRSTGSTSVWLIQRKLYCTSPYRTDPQLALLPGKSLVWCYKSSPGKPSLRWIIQCYCERLGCLNSLLVES